MLKQSLVVSNALSWSPDGSTIAFGKAGVGENNSIWVMAPDGGGAAELIPNATYPAYSPDGTRIAYITYEAGHIFTADVDGTDAIDLGVEGSDVDWSVASCSPSGNRPDAKIKLSGSFIGNNVYSPTAQSVSTKAPRGVKRTFTIEIENDGGSPDYFTLEGTGTIKGFTAKYLSGNENISDEVSDGGFETPTLSPGESFTLKLVIRVKNSAKVGVRKSWTLTATSEDAPTLFDAVKAKVKVVAN